jgi:tetratricopeptide (TPR) repeat protein
MHPQPPSPPAPDHELQLAAIGDEATSAPARPRPGGGIVIVGLAALVLGPVAYVGVPREISRWHEALATQAQIQSDHEAALSWLEASLAWWPQNTNAYLRRASWRIDAADFPGALADCQRAVELEPEEPTVLIQLSLAHQSLGQHSEAIALWKQLAQQCAADTAGNRARMLNGLAYAQALGNVELDDALHNVEQALNLLGDNPEMLDTRGYIQLLRGEYEAALADLDRAVEQIERRLALTQQDQQYVEQYEQDELLRQTRHHVAVIRYHRALLHAATGHAEAAEADHRRVRELGFKPDASLF